MITITPIQSKKEQERLCALCHVPYRTEHLAYEARNDAGRFVGLCQFTLNAGGGHICELAVTDPGDPDDALFVLGRATLNFMDLCGTKTAFFDGSGVSDAILRRIGFATDSNGRYTVSLDGFFTHPCQHHDC